MKSMKNKISMKYKILLILLILLVILVIINFPYIVSFTDTTDTGASAIQTAATTCNTTSGCTGFTFNLNDNTTQIILNNNIPSITSNIVLYNRNPPFGDTLLQGQKLFVGSNLMSQDNNSTLVYSNGSMTGTRNGSIFYNTMIGTADYLMISNNGVIGVYNNNNPSNPTYILNMGPPIITNGGKSCPNGSCYRLTITNNNGIVLYYRDPSTQIDTIRWESNPGSYTQINGVNYLGNDIRSIFYPNSINTNTRNTQNNINIVECLNECDNTTNCTGIVFDNAGNTCYLKSNLQNPVANTNKTVYYKGSTQPPQPAPPPDNLQKCKDFLYDRIVKRYWAFDTTGDNTLCPGYPPIAFTAPFQVKIGNSGWIERQNQTDAYNYIVSQISGT